MKKLKLTRDLLSAVLRVYSNGKDLNRDPRLYVSTITDMLRNSCGADFSEDEFYLLFNKVVNPHLGFKIDKSSGPEGRPEIFYRE